MVTVLITGSAGFVGFHLARRLLEEGHDLVGVDNLDPYYNVQLKLDRLEMLRRFPKFRFVKSDFGTLSKHDINDVEFVFHEAALAGVRASIENPILYNDVNVVLTVKLLKLCTEARVEKLIFASSSSVYGETEFFPTTEDSPTNPKNPYGASKLAAEKYCDAFYKCYGLPAISLRYFTVYGPWGRPDMFMWKVLDSCFGGEPFLRFVEGGKPVPFTRDFSFVGDVVEANFLAMRSKIKNDVFNIGSGKETPIDYVISLISKETGKEPKSVEAQRSPADALRSLADISKAKKMLGFEPKTSIEDGIKQLVEWYRKYKGV